MSGQVNWYETVFRLIDMRSFSNLWYWLALAVVWSSASHFVLGVPYDMLLRARRRGGQAERDFEDIVRINVNRLHHIETTSGEWVLGIVAFWLTSLALLGFYYGVEFAQAVFLIVAPLMPVGYLTLRLARAIARDGLTGPDLWHRIAVTRIWIQGIGMLAIFVTALWGMYQNLLATLPYG